nr:unnamed protein product [Haemonchus contortus]
MSSTITEDKSTASKTPEINRKELEALTNVLFLRKNTDKVSSYQKAQKKPVKEIEGHRIHERMPMDRKEGIFRLCRYDSEADLKVGAII